MGNIVRYTPSKQKFSKMTLTDKNYSKSRRLKELLKFLINSKHKLFIFSLWIFCVVSIIIFPSETMYSDNIFGRILVASRVFFVIYTIIYMILIYINSKNDSFDIDTKLTSWYFYLAYIIIFILLIFFGLSFDVSFLIFFFLFILFDLIFFLIVPSSLLMKYIEKRNIPIPHPLRYILIISFISFISIWILSILLVTPSQLKFGAFEISLGLFIASSFMAIIGISILLFIRLIGVKNRKLDQKGEHIKMILILIITFVAFVMIIYRLIFYVINYEIDVLLNSLSFGLLIFKDLLLIFIIFSIKLYKVEDINDKSKSDKIYLYILQVQTLMLYELLIFKLLFESNTLPTWYPDLILPIIVIIAIICAYIILNRKYNKNPNALNRFLISPQPKSY